VLISADGPADVEAKAALRDTGVVRPRPLPYVDPEAPRGAVSRTMIRLLGTRPMLWFERTPIWRILWWRLLPRLWRLTGGRLGGNAPMPTGLLETRDARNGRPHRRVLFYFHDDGKVTLIATKGGLPRDPYWYDNALASPEVRFAEEPFRAEPVDAEAERKRLWALADRYFPPFAAYRAHAARTGREIPILQLTPR
jgi:deazaflavin-dependent oxidoreductase (nitroreductase family)